MNLIAPQGQPVRFAQTQEASPAPAPAPETFAAVLHRVAATSIPRDLAIPFETLGVFGAGASIATREHKSTHVATEAKASSRPDQAPSTSERTGVIYAETHATKPSVRSRALHEPLAPQPRAQIRHEAQNAHGGTVVAPAQSRRNFIRAAQNSHGNRVRQAASRAASSILVYFQSSVANAAVCARVGRMEPTERSRLRQAIEQLLAEYGVIDARILLNGMDTAESAMGAQI